ncbi:hypothetical protein JX265_004074 [Neoarthrinium moseri]|uniref:Uncharacterized protein n=1 Tax=Neoarthrinium moseri TaxID=1658444 RepID=A0A9Q0ARZ9_9PEZI|nr:uncharacterized protein JN550_008740 [Neoarthrinium moseri]KAI1853594.1 hypothetical protein JX266_001578 [Neoarthrinium moseri]KAI1864920.1 hypothetical protein JN550_008740 [Neoarthrinium moseri]KAI1876548.1 hypothetical protein JX265_004074 [Neoarthrinium moseri]
MASSPRTPRHSRQSSMMENSYPHSSPGSSPVARRASKSSTQDPMTPLRNSMNDQDMSMFSGTQMEGGDNGLGNLADELADAFSEDEDEEGYYEDGEQPPGISLDLPEGDGREGVDGIRDSGVDVESQGDQKQLPNRNKAAALSLPPNMRGHRRQGSQYDGSEYGSDSDLESPGIPPSLVARMDAVESLARRGTDGGPADGVFKRVTDGLKDLGSQSGVEGSTTRLITAHSALATHLAHQTRQLHNLTFPLLSPLVAPPDAETIDDLLPLLVSLADDMPRPTTSAYNSLANLHSVTSDLVQTLNYLSDTLHMSRQTTTTAARRLKSAKEMVAEMKREEELKEEGERWLNRGNWGERLQNRECAGVCRDVVGGFEEVCNGWRARLLAQAESAS